VTSPVRYLSDMTAAVGRTPLVRLNTVVPADKALFLLKLEARNPGGSLKDRIALGMIEAAEKSGRLKPGMALIEPTSGNTGIALAWIAAVKGYRAVIVMPESMSSERRNLLRAYGAELVLTPASQGMAGAIDKAKAILATRDDCFMLQQFENPHNPETHRRITAEEIWEDTQGTIDVLVTGVGTGGFITGVGQVLKQRRPSLHIVAVEPTASPVLSGGKAGWHDIQGIGAGFVPTLLDKTVIDEIIQVNNDQAFDFARRLAREEGLLAGPSTGANVCALNALGQRSEFRGKVLVSLVCDSGERYLSTGLHQGN
jgi:cysteine synthase